MKASYRKVIMSMGLLTVLLFASVIVCMVIFQSFRWPRAKPTIRPNSEPKGIYVAKVDSPVHISRRWLTSSIESREHTNLKLLLKEGQNAMALSVARDYYNIARLSKTEEAAHLFDQALIRARHGAVTPRVYSEQDPHLTNNSQEPLLSNNNAILQKLTNDRQIYKTEIQKLETNPLDFDDVMGCGNLLLLALKPQQARIRFEFALQMASEEKNKPGGVEAALDGIGRSIRDENHSFPDAIRFIHSLASLRISETGVRADSPAGRIHAAAMKILNSLNSSLAPDTTHYSSVESPAAKAADDAEIAFWLTQWEATGFSDQYAIDFRGGLLQQLSRSKLPPLSLMAIGRAISFYTSDDWIAAAFYAAGATNAHEQLASGTVSAADLQQNFVAMILAKKTLWRVVDTNDRNFVTALYLLNCDLADRIPADDPRFGDARIHGFIGGAECLWLNGKNSDAMNMLTSVSGANANSMTAEENRAAAWIRGLILFSMNKYAEAATQFETVANDPPYAYTENSWRLLAICVARSGNKEKADTIFDDWVRRYRPQVKDAATVLQIMMSGKPSESNG